MNRKRRLLPNALSGWTLEEDLHVVDGQWTRIGVWARGPQYPTGRWNKLFQGAEAESEARAFMRERDGVDPADAS
jgi:hypothetical protein